MVSETGACGDGYRANTDWKIRKLGAQITDSQKAEAELKARQYSRWLDEQYFKDGCGSALLLLPVWEIGKVIYRNEYRGFVFLGLPCWAGLTCRDV